MGELAAKLGLDPERVTKTIDDFNAAVRPGKFHSTCPLKMAVVIKGLAPAKTHWARRIDDGPFFCHLLRPGITFTYLGLKVNHNAQVLMEDGRPVRNLWAAGEIMAGNILGEGYTAGVGMAIGTVSGASRDGGRPICTVLKRTETPKFKSKRGASSKFAMPAAIARVFARSSRP